jgi:hypothetical protein
MKRIKEGDVLKFKASNVNIGAVTINERRLVMLHKNGKPLMAGDLVPDQEVRFDRETGEVLDEPSDRWGCDDSKRD